MKNYWIIGDIHGEIRLLNRLLESVLNFHPDRLIFVGDYIDRGPQAREVVDRILSLEVPVSCLMGNHELMMLNAIEDLGFGMNPVELWYYNGGEATLQSFGSSSFFSFQSDLDPHYLKFFRSLKMSEVIQLGSPGDLLVSHAGISPFIPLEEQLALRNYEDLRRYLIENHLDAGDSFLWVRDAFYHSSPDLWQGYLVVHGHTPVLKLKRFVMANGKSDFHFVDNDVCIRKEKSSGKVLSVNIDSGSAISGRLTGLGLFMEKGKSGNSDIRMRSLTVSREEIFPRDLGLVTFGI